jgi:Concanavalin A-like lectin/glucanases superfamily/Putative Ig domain/Cellulase (glycosyl hydrolase family 5)
MGQLGLFLTSRQSVWTAYLLFALTLGTMGNGQTPSTAFTQPFDYTTTKIGISPASKWGVFKVGDTVSITTSNNSPITVFDLYGQTVYAGAPASRTFGAGHYFVQCNGDRNQFVVLPAGYSGASFLGATLAPASANDYLQPVYSQLAVQWVRTSSSVIDKVHPDGNTWNWSKMDAVVAANPSRNIIAMAAEGPVPSWIQPSQLVEVYTNFVTALAQRYKGKLAAIEIWNEPWQNLFYNDPNWLQTLAQLTIQGATAIHAVDPTIQVMAPTWNWSANYSGTATLAQLGATPFIDTLTWHDYEDYRFPPDEDVSGGFSNVLTRIALYRQAAQFSGLLAITELGLWGNSALGMSYGWAQTNWPAPPVWTVAMARTIKQTVMYRAGGADVLMPQGLATGCGFSVGWDSTLGGWEYGNRGPAPKTSAFLMTCYWLNGAQLADYRTLGRSVFLFAWQRPDNTSVAFAWSLEGQSVSLNSTAGLNPTDIFGRSITPSSLTAMPILFQSNSSDASALLSSVMSHLPDINLPPVVDPVGNQTVLKGQTLQFTVPASDPDNDPIAFSASPLPVGATIDPSTGLFSWTPDSTQAGSYSITLAVTDARGMSSSTSTIINVIGNPHDGLVHRWKLDDGSGAVAADSAGSDDGILVNFDPDSAWVSGSNGAGLSFNGTSSYVSVDSSQINLTNNFTIAGWVYPRDPTIGSVFAVMRFKYEASGLWVLVTGNQIGIGGQTASGWLINFFAHGQIQADTWYHLALVYDKSTWEVYLNGVLQPIAYGGNPFWGGDLLMDPTRGSALGFWDGMSFNGVLYDVRIYSRTLTAPEVLALYQFADQPLSLAPIGPKSVTVNQTLNFTVSAMYEDGTNLTYSAEPLPVGATFDPVTRTFNWTPTPDQAGAYNVTFTVTDGIANDSQMVTITVNDVNQPPVLAFIGPQTIPAGDTLGLILSASDANGDALTYYSATPLPSGAELDAANGAFTWTPQAKQVGSYALTFGVTDGQLSDSETVSITVTKPIGKPVLKQIKPKLKRVGRPVRIRLRAKNPNHSQLTYSISPMLQDSTFDSLRHKFTWVTTNATVGTYLLSASVTDGTNTDTKPVSITLH